MHVCCYGERVQSTRAQMLLLTSLHLVKEQVVSGVRRGPAHKKSEIALLQEPARHRGSVRAQAARANGRASDRARGMRDAHAGAGRRAARSDRRRIGRIVVGADVSRVKV